MSNKIINSGERFEEDSNFARMLSYCKALGEHNYREWFHQNHKWYEDAKADFQELLELMRFWISDAAPALSKDIMYMHVKDWTYRIPRDMRIKNDKPPYDPSFRAYVCADRKSWLPIGYFIRIAPGTSCFGTGVWCWDTEHMNMIRDYIMNNIDEFDEIVRKGNLTVTGDKLKTMPRGYSENCDGAEWMKFKNWSVIFDIPDEKLNDFNAFGKMVCRYVKRLEPFRQFMLRAAVNRRQHRQELTDFYNI